MTRTTVALYARISEDSTGEGAGVARQLADGRQLAEQRGWTVVAEHSDNNISALRGAHRPGYAAVLDLVGSGLVEQVVVWQTSRLWRNRRERVDGMEAFVKAGVGVVAVRGHDLDLSTAYGRGLADFAGIFDTMESEVKSERVTAAARQRAEQGRTNGGVLYGWTRIPRAGAVGHDDVIDPESAAVVREITDRLLAGEALAGVTRDLNARGVPAPGANHNRARREHGNADGSRWGKTSVKKMAMRPANVALRLYHRGRPDEALLPATWPAIVERDRWEAVCALLTEPSRRVERPASRQHLLTWGIGECGVCGGYLRMATKNRRSVIYQCAERGCVGRNKAKVDELVEAVVVGRLAMPDLLDSLAADDGALTAAQDRATGLRARLAEAADMFSAGDITGEQVRRITARLAPDLEEAEAEYRRQASARNLGAVAEVAGDRAAERWASLTVAQRRSVMEVLGLRVRVLRTGRVGPTFVPRSVEITWRDTPTG